MMNRLRTIWRSLFDVRPGEAGKTIAMTFYLMIVLFAYYILKPVSRALFLNKFDIDKLPWLYVLIAAVGGVLAYFYTKLAVNSSLKRAVNFATIFAAAVMVGFWWLIQLNFSWVVYAFNIWVSLFSIILVSQGWLIAANIFTTREAKRLYGILGVGSVIGAAFGGTFTAFMVRIIGTTNLILACAGMVLLSYVPFLFILRQKREALEGARAGEAEEDFSFGEILGNLRGNRHLQVIMAIMTITFVIDVMVEFQFNAMAKMAYHDKADLTAFLGNFYGFYLNLITFVCQFFLTGFIISRFGVGGTLQIMPITIALASIGASISPGILSTAATRLTEASTRYSFNKTGMELLYLPLPLELRNRTKAFVDVFVDRLARGLGGMILVLLTSVIVLPVRGIAVVVACLSLAWILLSIFAQKEYIRTVRRRLESRRLEFESARISVDDKQTIQLLEQTAMSDNPRQAVYALSLLNDAHGYDATELVTKAAQNRSPEVRAHAYTVARERKYAGLRDAASAELRNTGGGTNAAALRNASLYSLAFAENSQELVQRLLGHRNAAVAEGAVEFAGKDAALNQQVLTREWLHEAAESQDPGRRRLAAMAIGIRGDEGTEALFHLLEDPDKNVASAAVRSAGALQERQYLPRLLDRVRDANLRGEAIDAVAAYGDKVVGSLEDILTDQAIPVAVKRHIPRILRKIETQRSVDTLMRSLNNPSSLLRGAVLRALNRLQENAPKLNYGSQTVTEQIMSEARYFYEMTAALTVFREQKKPHSPAGLLVSTLELRLTAALERVFRLLGLRYPAKQMYAAYLAVQSGKSDDMAAALEFLDTVLDKELKRVVVPILDDPGRVEARGRDLFGIPVHDPETALRSLLERGDDWLEACAAATAGQLELKALRPDIERVAQQPDSDAAQVARDAMVALA